MTAAFASLRATLRGRLWTSEEPGYAERVAALLWNALAAERAVSAPPAAIVDVVDTADVVRCVKFASAEKLRIAVCSGGHQWNGVAVVPGALQLDLSGLRELHIDAAGYAAWVGPGVRNGEFAAALAAHGLAFPCGHCSHVALGGYLLAGGLGWNQAAWGAACASVLGAEVVVANGEVLQVNAHSHPDLFDVVRGGGPLLEGVVAGFRVALQPLPGVITEQVVVVRRVASTPFAGWLDEAAKHAPRDLELTCVIDSQQVTLVALSFDAVRSGADLAAMALHESLLHSFGDELPGGGLVGVIEPKATDFPALFRAVDARYPAAHRALADSFWLDAAADAVLPWLAARLAEAPSPLCHALFVPARAAERVGLFDMPAANYVVVYAIWALPEHDLVNREWFATVTRRLADWSYRHYVGEADLALGSDTPWAASRDARQRLERCFASSPAEVLRAVREKYGGANLFASADLAKRLVDRTTNVPTKL